MSSIEKTTDKVSFIKVLQNSLSSLAKNDGQIIVTTDAGNLFFDLSGMRIQITDWITVNSLTDLTQIATPYLNKFYYIKDTNKIWKHTGSEWVCLNPDAEQIYEYDSLGGFPISGKDHCLYIDKGANKTYRYDTSKGNYYCVGSDYHDIKLIDASF